MVYLPSSRYASGARSAGNYGGWPLTKVPLFALVALLPLFSIYLVHASPLCSEPNSRLLSPRICARAITVPNRYFIRAVGNDPSSYLFATHQGSGKEIKVAPKGQQGQEWEITPASGEEPGYNIRPCELNNSDTAYLHNVYLNGSVILAERQLLRVNPDGEYYNIWGPSRAGTYGAPDWIGVIGDESYQGGTENSA
ncbi:hypothetical protein B0J17DRAFT_628739 [Rhizoctonia solani]|nr:hypothetical protein B0J17DRAFT_628739 [Rhizoctonia solani]